MATTEANGQELYYEVHGDGEPLVCVMGLGASTLAWALQVQPFAERHRTVIFDNRDVGRSSMTDGPYEVSDMAADALALADALELDSFHLLGYSLGGAIAQEVALAAPERVSTLTLAVTFSWGGKWSRKLGELWGERVQRMSFEERVDELMLLTLSREFFENDEATGYMRSIMLADPHPQPPEAFARQVRAVGGHDTRDRLGSLQMPTHVIGAEYDILVPVWETRAVAGRIPGARWTEIERCPHGANVERAGEFNDLVLEFVAEHSRAPV